MNSLRAPSVAPALLAVLVTLGACGNDKEGATPSDSATNGSCTPNASFQCSEASLWASPERVNFGKDDFPIDADGCMRSACRGDEDCAAGELCYTPACYPLNVECMDRTNEDGHIACTCSADPACGGSYCKKRG